VNDPLLGHPQANALFRVARAKRISPCGVHLGRHREQSPCERAQRTGWWHSGVAVLAAVWSLTATAPMLWQRRTRSGSFRSEADVPGRHGAPTIRLRMAGVVVSTALRVVMVIGRPHLRMARAPPLLGLRVAG
jgi:hypothetical protein